MKITVATLVVIGATLSNAIAVAEARKVTNWGWCGVRGSACLKTRDVAVCGMPGNPCARLKRSAEAVADAFAVADPEARKVTNWGWCGVRGSPCEKVKRDAEARKVTNWGWCGVRGSSCMKARSALIEVGSTIEEAINPLYAREAEALAEADADPRKVTNWGWCGVRGSACLARLKEKRAANAEAIAEANADPRKVTNWGWCGVRGSACEKVKRDAEASPDARKVTNWGWCGVRGSACEKAKRDAEASADAISKAAAEAGVTEFDEEAQIAARDAPDGEGTALRAAYEAFMHIKREDTSIANEATPIELLAHCDIYDCSEHTVEAIAARAAGTLDARAAEACDAEGGACNLAKRQLDEIEAKLAAAVMAL